MPDTAPPAFDSERASHHGTVLGFALATLFLSVALQVRAPDTVFFPALEAYPLPDVCWSRRLTGYPCPGCGMTRSFISMAHLDYTAAFEYHLLGPVLFLAALAQVPYRLWRLRTALGERGAADKLPAQDDPGVGPSWMRPLSSTCERYRGWFIWVFAAALVAAWLFRIATLAGGRPP